MIFNQKGGVGKTTTVVNIAGCLSKKGKKVLVCDIDGQCTSTKYLNAIEARDYPYTIFDFALGEASSEDIVYPVRFSKWSPKDSAYVLEDTNISLIPSDKRLGVPELTRGLDNNDIFTILFSDPFFEEFDYCIFDCPGYISVLTECALRTCDYILTPALADIDSLEGFDDLINTKNRIRETTSNVSLDILGVVLTAVSHISVNRQILESLKTQMGEKLFDNYIRDAAAALDARVAGKPLAYYKPNEGVARDYNALTDEIIEKIGDKK